MSYSVLILHIVGGAIGGNVGGSLAGAIRSGYNLRAIGNFIAGIVGGLVVWYASRNLMAARALTSPDGPNLVTLFYAVLGGGMGGAVLAVIAGLIKSSISKG
jgi:hypothetical protein